MLTKAIKIKGLKVVSIWDRILQDKVNNFISPFCRISIVSTSSIITIICHQGTLQFLNTISLILNLSHNYSCQEILNPTTTLSNNKYMNKMTIVYLKIPMTWSSTINTKATTSQVNQLSVLLNRGIYLSTPSARRKSK